MIKIEADIKHEPEQLRKMDVKHEPEHLRKMDAKHESEQLRKMDVKHEPEQLRKMFIGGLDYSTTDESLKAYYEKWGTVVDVVVMKDPKTRRSRGFGFITYSQASMVDDAMNNRPHTIDGRHVEPKRAVPRDLCSKGEANVRKLFIGGIGKAVTKDDLEEYFGKYGTLTDCAIVVTKDTGEPRGFGFVEYDDVDSADKVILIRDHEIKGRKVEIKKAIAREEINKDNRRVAGGRDNRNGSGDFRNGQANFGGWNNRNNSGPWSNQQGPPVGNWGGGQGNFNNWNSNNRSMNSVTPWNNQQAPPMNVWAGDQPNNFGMNGNWNNGPGPNDCTNMNTPNVWNNQPVPNNWGNNGPGNWNNNAWGNMSNAGNTNNMNNMGFNSFGGPSGGGPMRNNYGSSNNRPTPYPTSEMLHIPQYQTYEDRKSVMTGYKRGINNRRSGGGGGQFQNCNSFRRNPTSREKV